MKRIKIFLVATVFCSLISSTIAQTKMSTSQSLEVCVKVDGTSLVKILISSDNHDFCLSSVEAGTYKVEMPIRYLGGIQKLKTDLFVGGGELVNSLGLKPVQDDVKSPQVSYSLTIANLSTLEKFEYSVKGPVGVLRARIAIAPTLQHALGEIMADLPKAYRLVQKEGDNRDVLPARVR